MLFLEATDLLKVEDVLPFFPDFVVIDDFKAEICTALEQYAARIDELRAEMNEATQSAESIKRDIEALSNRFVTVEPGDKCWRCGLALSLRQFYVFPCQHTFHADCMISVVGRDSPRIIPERTPMPPIADSAGHGVPSRTVTPSDLAPAERAY